MIIKRGDIFVASLDPVIGKEISKTRPVIVVSNDVNNRFSDTVSVLPLTSKHVDRVYPFEVFLPKKSANLPKDSKVKANQIRTIDKSRLVSFMGRIDRKDMSDIDLAMKVHLGL
jgi:mRNA interferase MazF